MNYKEKLKTNRYRESSIQGRDFNNEMESDRGRAINSAAVRRLQQKTQVFPLETNAAVRSRLTHSLEVQQVGRYISKLILKKLGDKFPPDLSDGFISAVEIACLLHDIGNPPFGHFGEEAINLWAKNYLKELFTKTHTNTDTIEFRDLLIRDLCSFEGNAQGIRLLHHIQGLNLTYTQLACLIKYTRAAYEPKPEDNEDNKNPFAYRKKKPGYYYTENDLYNKITQELSIQSGCRFPLTYIMEAADDISYCIADIDDAIDKGILSIDKLHNEIKTTWRELINDVNGSLIDDQNYLCDIATLALANADKEQFNKSHAYMLTIRTTLVNDLSNYAAERYIENHNAIFNGDFDESLLDGSDKFHMATETLKNIAIQNVFNDRDVENLELKGYSVISGLLQQYSKLISLQYKQFKSLILNDRLKTHPIETRLYHKLSKKHKNTYLRAVKDIFEKEDDILECKDILLEHYHRAKLIIDYISGMTDGFALEEYRNLSAAI